MTHDAPQTGLLTTGRDEAASADLDALFAQIAEGASERERERILPFEQLASLRAARFGAYRLPVESGGTGSSLEQLFEKILALAEADSNVAHILRNHFVFVERFARHPDTPQARVWQQRVAEGAIFGLANTELAKARSGAPSVTRLTREGDHYRLNGVKFYSTGSLFSDFVIVRARDDADRAVTAIIPADRDGVTLEDDWDAAGQRLTGSGSSRFENVRVEAEEVIVDDEGKGYGRAYKSTLPQLFLTAVNTGILRAILRDARALIHQRSGKAFFFAAADTPAQDPLLLKSVGELSAQVFAAETTVLSAARAQDVALAADIADSDLKAKAHAAAVQAAKAKVIVDDYVLRAGNVLFDLGGASSTQRSHNLDRHWRNARTVASHNPAQYKALALGNLELNDIPLPDKDFF
ncbi:acyl-CoA dehydrogenase family protein [Pseudochelatococcus contaminans]|uniref:Alkylation response protein AidB-like acyl-CoA dehydrogenase n=1 Tax=Pseudochelatococcus contaminans TaxID=1538103 RepID=A0A7W5Z5D6_9HYPH|nr:acyl-CoA dehydrogenase family protein [Pseudochelatococcus contaminans]MBB3810505.1 alkylation response protein AidB-like acyl-CoA dehydrogenase [Pseudochelatococcus contaminans]